MLAVIIPTLNAESSLRTLLPALTDLRVVVSDGGSEDETLEVALKSGAVIAQGVSGRGAQLSRGPELAGAVEDISAYLFLHSDSQPSSGWRDVVETALETENVAWYFRYQPDAHGFAAVWLKWIVKLRCWAWRLPYGDQGLLIPRDMYEALGGYDRGKALFEDVDIVDRIKAEYGRKALRSLPMGLKTDVSGYLREGVWKRGWRNYNLLRAYRRGTDISELIERYK